MEPTFQTGAFLLGSAWISPKAGHVAVVKAPHYSNNYAKGYYSENRPKPIKSIYHIKRISKIDEHGVWVEGDNKQGSTDSRHYGYIQPKDIKGIVFLRLMR